MWCLHGTYVALYPHYVTRLLRVCQGLNLSFVGPKLMEFLSEGQAIIGLMCNPIPTLHISPLCELKGEILST